MTTGKWEEKSATKVNFGDTGDKDSRKVKIGQTLEGRILSAEETTLDGRPHNYTLDEGDGKLVTFLGTASLDRLLKDEVGQLVRVKYLGDVKSGGGFMVKQFAVSVYRDHEAEEAIAADSEPKM